MCFMQGKYRDTGSMIEKAAKQPAQPWSKPEEEQQAVSRYQAMKAAANAALNRQAQHAAHAADDMHTDVKHPHMSIELHCLR